MTEQTIFEYTVALAKEKLIYGKHYVLIEDGKVFVGGFYHVDDAYWSGYLSFLYPTRLIYGRIILQGAVIDLKDEVHPSRQGIAYHVLLRESSPVAVLYKIVNNWSKVKDRFITRSIDLFSK